MISKSEIIDPVGTSETVWLPYLRGHLYAAYEDEDRNDLYYWKIWLNIIFIAGDSCDNLHRKTWLSSWLSLPLWSSEDNGDQ